MTDETNSDDVRRTKAGPEKSVAVVIAAASLALGIAGAFVAWRDYVHTSISVVTQSVAVIQTDYNARTRELAIHLARIDKLEGKLDGYISGMALLSERVARCENKSF